MSTEIEFKWDANVPRAFWKFRQSVNAAQVQVLAAQKLYIKDVYLDTPTQDFEKEKIAFRVRCVNRRWEATFKTRTEVINGKAVRREETLPLAHVKNLTQALAFLTHKKTWKGLRVKNLSPLFVLKNKRQTQEIACDQMRAELAFDTCEISVCGRRVYFKEIELELKKGSSQTLEKLAEQFTQASKLKRAKISKVKTALSLRALWGENDGNCGAVVYVDCAR